MTSLRQRALDAETEVGARPGGHQALPLWARLRLSVLLFGLLAGLAAIATYLYTLQVLSCDEFERKVRKNALVVEWTDAPRGRIFDRHGKLLVGNEPEFQVSVIPAELPALAQSSDRLHRVLGLPLGPLRARLNKAMQEGPLESVLLKRGLSTAEVIAATQLAREVTGVYLRICERRRYYDPLRATHLLGYTGEINAEELLTRRRKGYRPTDILGKAGLERQYDMQLRGRKGITHQHIDALGRSVRASEVRPPTPGLDLVLTLDLDLQARAEEALRETLVELRQKNGEPSAGAVVVLGARSGRVLALAGLPQYDPRPFARGIKPQEYNRLLSDPQTPLLSRAFHGAFSPGSTFKIINSSASLSEGLCTGHTTFYCGGSYAGANCFVRSGHGGISFYDSLAVSCDVVYYMLGVKLGIERLHRYCQAFGLGQPTGIDLPVETSGVLPDPAWKQKWVGDRWYEGDTVNMSIGQGFLLVSPLQMAVATAAVANGGDIYRPYLVEKMVSYSGRVQYQANPRPVRKVPVKPALLAEVRQGMLGAVSYGTATAANSELVRVAGKTGTVENSPSDSNRQGRNHTWFVSFAPAEKAEIVVVIFLEKSGGYGGSMCAPIARKVIDYYFKKRLERSL